MNFDQVLELIKVVSDSELTAFQYEEGNQKITMQAGGDFLNVVGVDTQKSPVNTVSESQRVSANNEAQESTQPSFIADANLASCGNVVTSPLVGRFYAAPAEDAQAYVKVGDTVKKGQVLAIVEAMKLMNEIESEYDGIVTEILADNGQGVEYGQPLFRITA